MPMRESPGYEKETGPCPDNMSGQGMFSIKSDYRK